MFIRKKTLLNDRNTSKTNENRENLWPLLFGTEQPLSFAISFKNNVRSRYDFLLTSRLLRYVKYWVLELFPFCFLAPKLFIERKWCNVSLFTVLRVIVHHSLPSFWKKTDSSASSFIIFRNYPSTRFWTPSKLWRHCSHGPLFGTNGTTSGEYDGWGKTSHLSHQIFFDWFCNVLSSIVLLKNHLVSFKKMWSFSCSAVFNLMSCFWYWSSVIIFLGLSSL